MTEYNQPDPDDIIVEPVNEVRAMPTVKGWMDRWDQEAIPGEEGERPEGLVQRILTRQGRIAFDLWEGGNSVRYLFGFGVILLLVSAAYGAVIGMAAGIQQAGYSAIKFPIVTIGSLLICFPSFYVFQCLMGARPSVSQALNSVFYFASSGCVLLMGLAPIAWFFTICTEKGEWRFLSILHLVFLCIAFGFGVSILRRLQAYFDVRKEQANLFHRETLKAWSALFVVVALQMGWYLRPLIVEGPFWSGERGIFLEFVSAIFSR